VIPARDEQDRIGACIEALAGQTVATAAYEVILVADACADRTEEVAVRTAAALGVKLSVVHGSGEGSGYARRLGMDLAASRLESLGIASGLIATTDADTRPAADWLERQLEHVALGARAIAGLIELDSEEAAALPIAVLQQREREGRRRLHAVREIDPNAQHHHFGGASIGVTANIYRRVGGLPLVVDLEDEAFARELVDHGVKIARPLDVRVRTAARTQGRARRGLSTDLAVWSWMARRRYSAEQFELAQLSERKGSVTVSLVVFDNLAGHREQGEVEASAVSFDTADLVNEVIVADRDSVGSRVRLGHTIGKGDAMWGALQRTAGDIVCFIDAGLDELRLPALLGLLGPLFLDPSIAFVNASFQDDADPTEIVARSLLEAHFPLLAGLEQPLAQMFSARRGLLDGVSFPSGHGVEIAVLLDALCATGLDALAEASVGARPSRAHPLPPAPEFELAVIAALNRRLDRQGR
jgi:hypothetical protein